MNEAETRKKLIDSRLALAGWKVNDPSHVIQELGILLQAKGALTIGEPDDPFTGPLFADYALLWNGKPIAVLEAKRATTSAELGREQALHYATHLQKSKGGRLPFILYSNGYDTFLWESEFYPPTKIRGFPSRDDLEWMDERRSARKPLSVEMIDTQIAGRDYQIAAIRSILEGVEKKRRRFLLVMATGTGKTRVATALVDVLRRATYPTMLNLIESGTTPATWVSPHFFDLVIADESHRSIYNIYKQVLDYFERDLLRGAPGGLPPRSRGGARRSSVAQLLLGCARPCLRRVRRPSRHDPLGARLEDRANQAGRRPTVRAVLRVRHRGGQPGSESGHGSARPQADARRPVQIAAAAPRTRERSDVDIRASASLTGIAAESITFSIRRR